MKQGTPISLQDFNGGLTHRLRGVWRDVEGVGPRETNNKLATYQALSALPFVSSCYLTLPVGWLLTYLAFTMLAVSRFDWSTSQNVSQFRLRVRMLRMWKLRLGKLGSLLCAIDAHADKLKMRSMSFPCVGMRE
eukprot:535412-Pelagomonas_calceolata.AAC.1